MNLSAAYLSHQPIPVGFLNPTGTEYKHHTRRRGVKRRRSTHSSPLLKEDWNSLAYAHRRRGDWDDDVEHGINYEEVALIVSFGCFIAVFCAFPAVHPLKPAFYRAVPAQNERGEEV